MTDVDAILDHSKRFQTFRKELIQIIPGLPNDDGIFGAVPMNRVTGAGAPLELTRFGGPLKHCAEEVSRWQKDASLTRVESVRGAGRMPGELTREFECSAQAAQTRNF